MQGVIPNGNWPGIMKTAGYKKKAGYLLTKQYSRQIPDRMLKAHQKIIPFYQSPALTLQTFFHLLFSTLHT